MKIVDKSFKILLLICRRSSIKSRRTSTCIDCDRPFKVNQGQEIKEKQIAERTIHSGFYSGYWIVTCNSPYSYIPCNVFFHCQTLLCVEPFDMKKFFNIGGKFSKLSEFQSKN